MSHYIFKKAGTYKVFIRKFKCVCVGGILQLRLDHEMRNEFNSISL